MYGVGAVQHDRRMAVAEVLIVDGDVDRAADELLLPAQRKRRRFHNVRVIEQDVHHVRGGSDRVRFDVAAACEQGGSRLIVPVVYLEGNEKEKWERILDSEDRRNGSLTRKAPSHISGSQPKFLLLRRSSKSEPALPDDPLAGTV